MPNPSSILIPDFNGNQVKSGVLADANGVNYPLVRFQDEVAIATLPNISGNYSNGQIIGNQLSFSNCAANNGWGGAIAGCEINVNNAVLVADTLSLLLLNVAPAVTALDATNLAGLALSDAEGDAYVGSITLANAFSLSNRILFSASTLNLKYVCAANSTALVGILVLNSNGTRTLSSTRINVTLQITKS